MEVFIMRFHNLVKKLIPIIEVCMILKLRDPKIDQEIMEEGRRSFIYVRKANIATIMLRICI